MAEQTMTVTAAASLDGISTSQVAVAENNTTLSPNEAEDSHEIHDWRFWTIMVSLGVTGLMSAIEGTIITSALPTIANALELGDLYVWVPNAFLLSSVAVLPLFAQASNIYGRRSLLLAAVALFTLGSGLSGGATSASMLIAARTVQGLGGGGINLLIETIVTDLVSLRERGKYMSLVMLGATVGAAIGPFLGGLITSKTSWRWCFYINCPIGAVAFFLLFFFLEVKHQQAGQPWLRRLARVDFAGNAIFVAAIIATLLALTWAGAKYSWDSFHIAVPLVFGFVGLGIFAAFEWTPKLCPEPSIPRKLVSNRTSAAALILTFLHASVTYWAYYFMPVYFQAVKGFSPLKSGVGTLPIFAGSLLFCLVGGGLLSKFGRYRPLHLFGFVVLTVSVGLLSLLDAQSSTAKWVLFEILWAIGSGLLIGILLPAMQAPLDESLVATATGLWSFIRYFGCIWGVTIPSAIFNNECRRYAYLVTSMDTAALLKGGRAYQYATQTFLNSIQDATVRAEVIDVFSRAMQTVWLSCVGFAGIGILVVFLQKEVILRDKVKSEFGLKDVKRSEDVALRDRS